MKRLELCVKEYKELLEEKMDYCVLRYENGVESGNKIIYHLCLNCVKSKYAYAFCVREEIDWLTDESTYSKNYMVQIPRREFLFHIL